jgi:hypothetical protein
MNRWWIAVCIMILTCGVVYAQEAAAAQFSATNQSPLVGEPVQLTLTARFSSGATMVEWPDFPEHWANFEVREVGELEISDQNGAVEYRQTIITILWEPGDYVTPETVIAYSDATGALGELFAASLPFTVPSVLTGDLTLRPLKPLVFLSYIPPALIVVGVFALAFPVVWFAQRRSKQVKVLDWQGDIRALDQRTLAMLSSIDRQPLEPSAVFAATADCLRDYLGQQFHIAAQELTTGELLIGLQPHLSKQTFTRLGQLLSQADLVKFARQIPNREAAQHYLETAARWIQAVADEAAQSDKQAGG